jgi:hypothetical protein
VARGGQAVEGRRGEGVPPARGRPGEDGHPRPPGREHSITDHTYACQDEASEEAWAQLITWKQALSVDQSEAIEIQTEQIRPEPE